MLTRQERQGGQIIVVFVLSIVVVIGMVGLVIDGGSVYAQQRGQQNAADLAALAGADALLNGRSQTQATTIAQGVAATNGYSNGVNGATVTVTYPTNTIKVDIGAPHQNYFAGIYGQPTWQVGVTASAVAGNPDTATQAAPFILSSLAFGANGQPLSAFTQAGCPDTGCVFGDGHHGDYPEDTGDFAWTLYGPNVNTAAVVSYLQEIGYLNGVPGCPQQDVTVVTYAPNDYIGQQNQGNHNGAISQAGYCIVGLTLPVPITGPPMAGHSTCSDGSHTNGCFYGWALFHVTGFRKDGNDSNVDGWFMPPPQGSLQYPWLSISDCLGSSCPPVGAPELKLVN